MIRYVILGAISVATALLPTAVAQHEPSDLGGVVDEAGPAREEPEVTVPELSPVDEILANLSLEQKVSQLMFVTLGGLYGPNEDDRRLLADFPPGGLIIPHITTPADAAIYVKELRSAAIESEFNVPFLLGTNAIGGLLAETPPARSFFNFPDPLTLTAAERAEPAESLARLIAEHIDTMGFNVHFGPALTLAPNIQAIKPSGAHFGSDPEFVAQFGATFLNTFRDNNVIWVPMGFPGGGANRNGEAPAVLTVPRSELAKYDLLPFAHIIDAGTDVLHVGNTLVPTLDPANNPASLSHKVMNDVLRGLLGFDGITIAGPLDTRDITIARNSAEAALMSLEAGADMLYWTRPRGDIILALGSIIQAVYAGKIDEQLIDEKVRRIIQFKIDNNLLERELPVKKKNQKLGKDERAATASIFIERASVTLIKNDRNILPLTEENAIPIGITGVVGAEELHEALEEYIEPISLQRIATARHIGRIQDFEIDRLTRRGGNMRNVICIFDDTVEPAGQVRLIRTLQSQGVNVIVVVVGPPTNLEHIDIADAVILAYADPENLARSMVATADVVAGKAPLAILPPERDMRSSVGQELSFDVRDVVRTPTGRLPFPIGERYVAGFSVAYNADLAIKRVRWDFGDGESSMQNRTSHAYAAPGVYPVTLTVTDEHKVKRSQIYHVIVE